MTISNPNSHRTDTPPPNPNLPYDALPPLTELPVLGNERVLALCVSAHKALAELKGLVSAIPNSSMLLRGLRAREAAASSTIEGIYSSADLILQLGAVGPVGARPATVEASLCDDALDIGERSLAARGEFSTDVFVDICHAVKPDIHGLRQHEVYIGNAHTRARSYTPPSGKVLETLLDDLAQFMNADDPAVDPLVAMAVAHYQFESIHPFLDGNGRTGRVLNALYLRHRGLLPDPVLHLSEYILRYRGSYYEGLRNVTFNNAWEDWICFILEGVATVAEDAIHRVQRIRRLRLAVRKRADDAMKRSPSDALINTLFARAYCTVADVQLAEGVARPTASRRIKELEAAGIVENRKLGRHRLYFISPLIRILTDEMTFGEITTMMEDIPADW